MCFAPCSSTVFALALSVYSFHTIAIPKFVIIALICNTCPNLWYILPKFVIKLALICNNEAAPICNNVCLYIFVSQFCCSYNNLCDLGWGCLTHRVTWLFDDVIKWYVRKVFIFTFARTQFFIIQGSFLLIYKQKLKSGKVTSSFRSQLTCERRSLFQDMERPCLSINLGL